MQGSTACLVRLVDLSASAHQGHSALVPPISSRIVQRCPKARRENTVSRRFSQLHRHVAASVKLAHLTKTRAKLTFPLCPSYSSRYRYLRASSDIQHFCKRKMHTERKLTWSNRCHLIAEHFKQMQSRFCNPTLQRQQRVDRSFQSCQGCLCQTQLTVHAPYS